MPTHEADVELAVYHRLDYPVIEGHYSSFGGIPCSSMMRRLISLSSSFRHSGQTTSSMMRILSLKYEVNSITNWGVGLLNRQSTNWKQTGEYRLPPKLMQDFSPLASWSFTHLQRVSTSSSGVLMFPPLQSG